jgi:hypothetical protein
VEAKAAYFWALPLQLPPKYYRFPRFQGFCFRFRINAHTAQPKLNIPRLNEKITSTKQSKSPLLGVVVIFVSLARF